MSPRAVQRSGKHGGEFFFTVLTFSISNARIFLYHLCRRAVSVPMFGAPQVNEQRREYRNGYSEEGTRQEGGSCEEAVREEVLQGGTCEEGAR